MRFRFRNPCLRVDRLIDIHSLQVLSIRNLVGIIKIRNSVSQAGWSYTIVIAGWIRVSHMAVVYAHLFVPVVAGNLVRVTGAG